MLVTWDKESILKNPERPKVSDTYHSDINDAVLYAWRECRHYLSEKPVSKPLPATNAYMAEMEREEAERMQRSIDDPEGFAMEEQFEQDMNELDSITDIWKL